jgi:F-type H+-transporting ATPase subunit epsilon
VTDLALALRLLTPKGEKLRQDCDELIIPGEAGELGVLPGHVPLITSLAPGVLGVGLKGHFRYFAVGTGYAEVEGSSVIVLTEFAEASDEIDTERAQQARDKANKALEAGLSDESDQHEQRFRIARAEARLRAAARRG